MGVICPLMRLHSPREVPVFLEVSGDDWAPTLNVNLIGYVSMAWDEVSPQLGRFLCVAPRLG